MRPSVPPFRRRPSRRTDLLVALAALLYFVWSFVPVWYRAGGGIVGGAALRTVSLNAWGGPTAPAAVLAIVAAAWVGARAGRDLRHPEQAVALDAALAVAALLLTLAGFLFRRPGPVDPSEPSWGLAVGAAVALAWTVTMGRGVLEARSPRHP
jgi:hypothetical protein